MTRNGEPTRAASFAAENTVDPVLLNVRAWTPLSAWIEASGTKTSCRTVFHVDHG
ncbi:hypothetical protein ACYX8G_01365 [Microbacterium saperdae]